MTPAHYCPDLAWVHHVGHGQSAEHAATGLLALLHAAGLPPGARVLDVGCGSGLLARRLVEDGFDVVGVDASPAMIDLARTQRPARASRSSRFRAHGVEAEERVRFGEERPLEGLAVLVGRRVV